jgi:hypothetical protein
MTFVTVPMRRWLPLEDSMMLNFSLVSLVTFHATCLAFEYGLHEGPVLGPRCEHGEIEPSREGKDINSAPEELLKTQSTGTKTTRKRTTNSEPAAAQDNPVSVGCDTESSINNSRTTKIIKPSTGELVRFVLWLLFRYALGFPHMTMTVHKC